jgi:PA14 domain
MRGCITAPSTGSYTFWIASDDNSELWLSTNKNPANKVKLGWVLDWTDSRQWNNYSTQKSPAITLTQGQQYYVEALQKEGGGGDNLAVGWAKPGRIDLRAERGDSRFGAFSLQWGQSISGDPRASVWSPPHIRCAIGDDHLRDVWSVNPLHHGRKHTDLNGGHDLSHYSFNYPAWRMSQARYVNTFALLDSRRGAADCSTTPWISGSSANRPWCSR